MPTHTDGPKNSQGYAAYPAIAGMTGRPLWQQLLDYTNGEYTEQVARAWLRELDTNKKMRDEAIQALLRGYPPLPPRSRAFFK